MIPSRVHAITQHEYFSSSHYNKVLVYTNTCIYLPQVHGRGRGEGGGGRLIETVLFKLSKFARSISLVQIVISKI